MAERLDYNDVLQLAQAVIALGSGANVKLHKELRANLIVVAERVINQIQATTPLYVKDQQVIFRSRDGDIQCGRIKHKPFSVGDSWEYLIVNETTLPSGAYLRYETVTLEQEIIDVLE